MPCSVALGYQRFGGLCRLQLHNPEDHDFNIKLLRKPQISHKLYLCGW